jgi:streptogrisin C
MLRSTAVKDSPRRTLAAVGVVLLALALLVIAEHSADARAPEQAPATDLALVAAARGWSVAQARADRRVADAFGKIQEHIAATRPDQFAGTKLSPVPGGAPTLYIKGKASQFVRDTVESAGMPIEVVEGRPFSWQELEDRSIRLNHRLAGLGFQDIVTSFDETTSTIDAVATRSPSLLTTAERVQALLPAEFQAGVKLELVDEAVAVDDAAAFGGNWVRDDGVRECTSGWSVITGATTGVTTAGHCDGINQIEEPGVGVHPLTHQAEHRGQWGDIEWKTSPVPEPDDFYASATDRRDVAAVEPRANITVGESICVYGRASDSRDCSHTVFRTSVSCTISGVFNDRLVAMNAKGTTIGGDSGGGWSVGNTAYGSHKGGCEIEGALRNMVSVADLYDEALGVRVRTS